MNPILIAIENREKGQVPISIGTSLALEAAFGIYPDRPESPAPITRVKQLWINLRTIVRNLYACLPTDLKDTVLPDDLWQYALQELAIIEAAVGKHSGQTKVVFFASDYARLKQRYPSAIIREPSTPKQLFQYKIEDITLRLMLENNHQHDVKLFDFDIQGHFPASLILTHLPIDLLARYRFERLELLESHTGKIKGPGAWYTKLTNGKELGNIPFNQFTLQLFGDNGNMFSPQPIGVRRSMLEAARLNNLTNVSSLDKVRDTIRKVPNEAHRTELEKLV